MVRGSYHIDKWTIHSSAVYHLKLVLRPPGTSEYRVAVDVYCVATDVRAIKVLDRFLLPHVPDLHSVVPAPAHDDVGVVDLKLHWKHAVWMPRVNFAVPAHKGAFDSCDAKEALWIRVGSTHARNACSYKRGRVAPARHLANLCFCRLIIHAHLNAKSMCSWEKQTRLAGDKTGAKALSSFAFIGYIHGYPVDHRNHAMLSTMECNKMHRYRIIFASCGKFISIRRVINAIKLIIFLVDLRLQARGPVGGDKYHTQAPCRDTVCIRRPDVTCQCWAEPSASALHQQRVRNVPAPEVAKHVKSTLYLFRNATQIVRTDGKENVASFWFRRRWTKP